MYVRSNDVDFDEDFVYDWGDPRDWRSDRLYNNLFAFLRHIMIARIKTRPESEE